MSDPAAGRRIEAMFREAACPAGNTFPGPWFVRAIFRRCPTMDGFRFSLAPRVRPAAVPLITRRQTLKGVAGGLALALASSSGLSPRSAAARSAETYALTNPASRVLLPGEAGLDHFGLDF